MAVVEEWSEADIFEGDAQAEQVDAEGLTLRTPSLRSLHSEATAANSPSAAVSRCVGGTRVKRSFRGRGVTSRCSDLHSIMFAGCQSTLRRARLARSGLSGGRSWFFLCLTAKSLTRSRRRSTCIGRRLRRPCQRRLSGCRPGTTRGKTSSHRTWWRRAALATRERPCTRCRCTPGPAIVVL